MLEVEPTGHHGCMANGSDRSCNEVIDGATSKAFARRLHHQCAPIELPSAAGISFCRV